MQLFQVLFSYKTATFYTTSIIKSCLTFVDTVDPQKRKILLKNQLVKIVGETKKVSNLKLFN